MFYAKRNTNIETNEEVEVSGLLIAAEVTKVNSVHTVVVWITHCPVKEYVSEAEVVTTSVSPQRLARSFKYSCNLVLRAVVFGTTRL